MIDPQVLDVFALPSINLIERSQLPAVPCIYFAIDSQRVIQYIGQTKNLRSRMLTHHRAEQFEASKMQIAYLPIDTPELLYEIESALISWFEPPLNGSGVIKALRETQLKWRLAAVMADREVDNDRLHELTGLHRGTISKLRNNPPSRVDMDTLNKLCEALNCQPGELLVYRSE